MAENFKGHAKKRQSRKDIQSISYAALHKALAEIALFGFDEIKMSISLWVLFVIALFLVLFIHINVQNSFLSLRCLQRSDIYMNPQLAELYDA